MSTSMNAVTISALPTQPAMSADDQALIDALARTSFVVMAVLNRIGAEHDLSLTQLRVLAILRDRRGRMSDLADYLKDVLQVDDHRAGRPRREARPAPTSTQR